MTEIDITLVIPPFTQLNTPYPSILYLNRHLKSHGVVPSLRDCSIEVALRLFSKNGIRHVFDELEEQLQQGIEFPDEVWSLYSLREDIVGVVDEVTAFL